MVESQREGEAEDARYQADQTRIAQLKARVHRTSNAAEALD